MGEIFNHFAATVHRHRDAIVFYGVLIFGGLAVVLTTTGDLWLNNP